MEEAAWHWGQVGRMWVAYIVGGEGSAARAGEKTAAVFSGELGRISELLQASMLQTCGRGYKINPCELVLRMSALS